MTTRRNSSVPPRRSSQSGRRSAAGRPSGRVPEEVREARRRKRHRQVIRNRIIFAIACLAIIGLTVTLVVKLVSAVTAGHQKADTSTLTFTDGGEVVFEEVTDFDTSEYEVKDIKQFVRAEIESYNDKHGEDSITLDKIKIKDNKCYIKTQYKTFDIYEDYTSYETYMGTVEQAADEGYSFEGHFAEVTDGSKGAIVETDILSDYAGCYVAVVDENCDVVVPGEIVYITDESTEITGKNSVRIEQADGNTDATNIVYIIFSIKNK